MALDPPISQACHSFMYVRLTLDIKQITFAPVPVHRKFTLPRLFSIISFTLLAPFLTTSN